MIKKIKSYILSAMMLLTIAAPAALPSAVVYASDSGCGGSATNSGVPNEVAGGAGTASGSGQTITCDPSISSSDTSGAVGTLAQKIVNIFSIVVGAASVFMIIYGGFRYITSGGSSERIGSAKNTLIYAIVGLIIVGLAQILVHFVLSQAASQGNSLSG